MSDDQAAELSPDERQHALRERMQKRVDAYNASKGNLNLTDGYDCKLCMNRGDSAALSEHHGGVYEAYPPCRCMEIRRSIQRMKQSGLESSIRDYTFKKFKAQAPWQQSMLDMAKRYLDAGVRNGAWLYMGGQPGCGKTHICTAVAGKLLYEMPILYVVWPQISKKLKALVMDASEYERELLRVQTIDLLYIDDLFKPVKDDSGRDIPPSGPDVRLAFELLNYRYVNHLPTILSSEWHPIELNDLDEATGSRIAERSRGYCMTIARDKARNMRFSNSEEV